MQLALTLLQPIRIASIHMLGEFNNNVKYKVLRKFEDITILLATSEVMTILF